MKREQEFESWVPLWLKPASLDLPRPSSVCVEGTWFTGMSVPCNSPLPLNAWHGSREQGELAAREPSCPGAPTPRQPPLPSLPAAQLSAQPCSSLASANRHAAPAVLASLPRHGPGPPGPPTPPGDASSKKSPLALRPLGTLVRCLSRAPTQTRREGGGGSEPVQSPQAVPRHLLWGP